jgi:hypothetical protein
VKNGRAWEGALACRPAGDGQSEKLKSELPRYSVSEYAFVLLRPKAALSVFAAHVLTGA